MAEDDTITPSEDPQAQAPASMDAERLVARLALISAAEYDRVRKKEASGLGVRVTTLDALVEERRAANNPPAPARLNGHTRKITGSEIILDRSAPLANARIILKEQHTHESTLKLYHQQSVFVTWTGTHYREYLHEELRSDVYHFLEKALVYGKDDTLHDYKPNARTVSDILDSLRAACQLENTIQAPAWLEQIPDMPPAAEMIACKNGLLHLSTGDMYPHRPDFYTRSALDYDYNPDAPIPQHWLEFLNSIWGKDLEAVDTLQQIFGYLLGNDSDQQKIPFLVGPMRSGKGTIGYILGKLVGAAAMVSPTLASLEGNFGMAPLLGKSVAVIADARLSGKADQARIAERLLSISGEDIQTVERKHIDAWTGKLPTRFFIMSNELPRISDPSGALSSRFVILTMIQSFLGKEDKALKSRLLTEMPGILNWAIEGWRALRRKGHFTVPRSSEQISQQLADLSSASAALSVPHTPWLSIASFWCGQNGVKIRVVTTLARNKISGETSALQYRA